MTFKMRAHGRPKPNREKNKMTEKKAKKTIRVRDLEPTKDARGGYRNHRSLSQREGVRQRLLSGGYGIHLVP
jgi:hypothetical protein